MNRFNRLQAIGLAVLIVGLGSIGAPAMSGDGEGGDIGFVGGFSFPSDNATGNFSKATDAEFGVGVRGGILFSNRWGWSIDGLYTPTSGLSPISDSDMITLRTGMEYFLQPDSDRRFFFSFGGGLTDIDYDTTNSSFDYGMYSFGIGQRVRVGDSNNFRWELRVDRSFDDDLGPFSGKMNQEHLLFAYSWGSGGSPTDSDGDGVSDRRDRCPGTPRGATVDERGCPKDSDGDGVFDGIDACPDTPKGWPVDGRGCALDSDGDGVADGKDDCPDTPRGATVNDVGCPKDSDGDGVWDGIDKCPDTRKGSTVDATGCPKDSDGDGVWDGIDKCPNTPKGATVDATGCPKDSDGDGVWDGIDRCPDTPAGAEVDERGCPKLFEDEKKSLVLEGVNFETNKAVLTSNSTTVLDRVVSSLKEWPEVRIEVGGHTDSSGADSYNQTLSEARARAVLDYLVEHGVSAASLSAKGYGESNPIADNGTRAGKATNRRVELTRQN